MGPWTYTREEGLEVGLRTSGRSRRQGQVLGPHPSGCPGDALRLRWTSYAIWQDDADAQDAKHAWTLSHRRHLGDAL
jgi:hypothetical protein